ncbi:MAG: type II toxin-antitoxin system VapC family toxin [Deltaproteobacteria bacterium]|nr:type II toxin-antitoxin system VapC family toxin [Deltaproteobacteria bacterium]
MIGLDTNVLVRYLVQDDDLQAKTAAKIIEAGDEFFINLIVICELVWVLDSCYELNKKDIILIIEKLLTTREITFEKRDTIWGALDDFKVNSVDFADCLIGRLNQSHDCETTLTFDKSLKKLNSFQFVTSY